jgi:hypothetical protein
MRKRKLIIIAGLAGVLLIGWVSSRPTKDARATVHTPAPAKLERAAPESEPQDEWVDEEEVAEEEEGPPSGKLDPKSEAFYERIDDIIPEHLYAAAADCHRTGLEDSEKIRLSVRIRVIDSEVHVADVRVLESSISDQGVEACIRDSVKNARWKDDEMPDWEDEDELLIRVRGLKKHLAMQPDGD